MNPEVASIRAYFYKLFPCKVYTKEVPEKFTVPSMYFPPPFALNSNDTLSTFLKTYSLPVKLFHEDSQQANNEAERIADVVNSKKGLIPLVDKTGAVTGEYVRISRIENRIADSGVAIIQVTWDSRYFYEKEEYTPLQNIGVDSGVK
ncbi:phage portal protein [Bacillus sp. REN10]|uniref:phage portal protein n=1 Tax=Bacillus sp. REN10 TaxID=2782541 RepID=UPI00193C6AC4|nr:phage portal protein [Bacillus sp. REN10]